MKTPALTRDQTAVAPGYGRNGKEAAARFVFVMPTYYPDTFGGLERQTWILAHALRARGCAITILAPAADPSMAGLRDEDGISVLRFAARRPVYLGGRYLVSMLSWWTRFFVWLARRRAEYDVIAVQHVRLHAMPGIAAGMALGKPLIGKIGRGGEHFELRRLRQKRLPFGKLVVALARRSRMAFVANSSEIARDLADMNIPADRILRIPNGVEVPMEPLAKMRDPRGTMLFVFAGRLEEEKGLLELFEGYGAFAARRDTRLDVYGGGPLQERLKVLANAPEHREKVRLHGVTGDREKIYGGAAYMILPSLSEGMSNALLEAMAYGVVPIVTSVSGASDLVDDGLNGFFLRTNSPAGIREGLERAANLDEPAWRAMSAAARQRVAGTCSIDAVADAYLKIGRGLIEGAARKPNALVSSKRL